MTGYISEALGSYSQEDLFYPLYRMVRPVHDLDPVRRAASAVRALTAFRDQAFNDRVVLVHLNPSYLSAASSKSVATEEPIFQAPAAAFGAFFLIQATAFGPRGSSALCGLALRHKRRGLERLPEPGGIACSPISLRSCRSL